MWAGTLERMWLAWVLLSFFMAWCATVQSSPLHHVAASVGWCQGTGAMLGRQSSGGRTFGLGGLVLDDAEPCLKLLPKGWLPLFPECPCLGWCQGLVYDSEV